MIGKLTGVVDAAADGTVLVDVGGVGYVVACSSRTLSRLVDGATAALFVETQVREDAIVLYGFGDPGERAWFRLLTGVQGVGGRLALSVLSALPPDELTRAVAAADHKTLTRADGVGPRLAARIVNELKDRLGGALPAAAPLPAGAAAAGTTADAVAAIVNLGFGAGEAFDAVTRAVRRLGSDAGIEALIRGGLAELAPPEPAT